MISVGKFIKPLILSASACALALIGLDAACADCINVREAHLKSGPGRRYEILWDAYLYMPVVRVGAKGRWAQVRDVDGDPYWIEKNKLTNKYKCAVVSGENVILRSGPGENHDSLGSAPVKKYYTFKVIAERDGWVNVEDEHLLRGWIQKDRLWIQ